MFKEQTDCWTKFEREGDEALAIENELGIIEGMIKIELDTIENLDVDQLTQLRKCYTTLDSLFLERLEYSERLDKLTK